MIYWVYKLSCLCLYVLSLLLAVNVEKTQAKATFTLTLENLTIADRQFPHDCCELPAPNCSCGNVTLSACLTEVASPDNCSLWEREHMVSTERDVNVSHAIEQASVINAEGTLNITFYGINNHTGLPSIIDTFSIIVNFTEANIATYAGDLAIATLSLSITATMLNSLCPSSSVIQSVIPSSVSSIQPFPSMSSLTLSANLPPSAITPSASLQPTVSFRTQPSIAMITSIHRSSMLGPSETTPAFSMQASEMLSSVMPTLLPTPKGNGDGQEGAVDGGVVAGAVIGTVLVLVLVTIAVIALTMVIVKRRRTAKSIARGTFWHIKAAPSVRIRKQKVSYISDADGEFSKSLTPDFLVVRHKNPKSTVPNGGQFLSVHAALNYNMNKSSPQERSSIEQWAEPTMMNPDPALSTQASQPTPTLSSTDDATLPRHIRSPSAETDSTQPHWGTSAASSLSRPHQNSKVYQMPSFEDDSIIMTNMGAEEEETVRECEGRQARNSRSL